MRISLLILTLFSALYQTNAQTSITFPSAVQQTGNVLRYDVSFSTSPAAKAYVEYFHVDGSDTITEYTNISNELLSQDFTLVGLLPQTQYKWRACAFDSTGVVQNAWSAFTTAALPNGLPNISQIDVPDAANTGGYVLTNTIRFGSSINGETAQIYDRQGNLVWYQFMNDLNLRGYAQCKFTIATNGPKVLYSGCNEVLELGFDGTVISNPQLSGTDTNYLIHHDIIKKDNGNFLAIAGLPINLNFSDVGGPSDSLVISESVIEIDPSGDVVWAWNAYEHLDTNNLVDLAGGNFWEHSIPGSGSWLHANGMDIDLDGGIIVSFRKSDQIIKINPNDSSVLWTLGYAGDYTIPISDRFSVQHCPTTTGGNRYLLFDNNGIDSISRVSEFLLIDYNSTAQQRWEYVLPQDLYSAIVSSAYRLHNGNTLIGSGVPGAIIEVDANGDEVLQMIQSESFYRANFIPALYEPTPDLSFTIADTLCEGEMIYRLTGDPTGGFFTGPGVVDNTFSPSVAGAGVHDITYHYGWKTLTQQTTIGCTGISDIDLAELNLQLFPNPASDMITLQFDLKRSAATSWNIVDLTGREMLMGNITTTSGHATTTMDISSLPAGMYLVGLNIEGQKVYRKVIVE